MPFLSLTKFAAFAAFPFLALSLHAFAGEPEGPRAPVRLEIFNGAESRLRCQLVLAHFVTQDIAPISPGDETVIELDRDADKGTLIFLHEGGPSMALENILCGLSGAWRETRADLDLAGLRAGETAELRIVFGATK